ncbi:MAG TPA: SDR family oxidoreductase [Bryobacteraceae bacterium]|nr:SDR family oxidoreductase [Bryobacteraceae bacterium]
MRFANQTAVVTGASSGIGRAVARAIRREGMCVALVGRSRERLEETANDGGSRDGGYRVYVAELADDASVRQLVAQLDRDLDGIDVLVHSAGAISLGSVEHATVEEFDQQYRVNLRAPFQITQALLPKLKRSRGQVIFINSTAGLTANANAAQYSATKHGLKGLADSLRDEVNAAGVRVISVFPGRVATPMQKALLETEGGAWKPERLMQPEDLAQVVVEALAVPRTAEVTNVTVRPMVKY